MYEAIAFPLLYLTVTKPQKNILMTAVPEFCYLAEAAPLGPAVEGGQPGNAGGGGGGEQGVQEGTGLPIPGRGGKHQQKSAQADDDEESHRDQLGGAHGFPPAPHTQRQDSLIQGQGRLPFPSIVVNSYHVHFDTMASIIKPLYQFFKTIFFNILFWGNYSLHSSPVSWNLAFCIFVNSRFVRGIYTICPYNGDEAY